MLAPTGHFADGPGRRTRPAQHGAGHHAPLDHRLADEQRLSRDCSSSRASEQAYYARLKGQGIDAPGNTLDFFLRHQDQANFDRDYEAIIEQADQIISGYCSTGMDNTIGYPGWMLGYWHGIVVAGGVDNLCGTPFCTAGAGPGAEEEAGHHHLRPGVPGCLGRQADQLRLGLDEHARRPLGRTRRHGLGALRSSAG